MEIGENCKITGAFIMKITDGAKICIGDKTTMGGVSIICGEGRKVSVGDDCMFSFGINLRTTDSHGIYDQKTKNRINPAKDIVVGDKVWVGMNCMIMKGSAISNGSVVGAGAFVSKPIETPNVLIAGNPAIILKEGVVWERELLG